jgi:hypothetical protein
MNGPVGEISIQRSQEAEFFSFLEGMGFDFNPDLSSESISFYDGLVHIFDGDTCLDTMVVSRTLSEFCYGGIGGYRHKR